MAADDPRGRAGPDRRAAGRVGRRRRGGHPGRDPDRTATGAPAADPRQDIADRDPVAGRRTPGRDPRAGRDPRTGHGRLRGAILSYGCPVRAEAAPQGLVEGRSWRLKPRASPRARSRSSRASWVRQRFDRKPPRPDPAAVRERPDGLLHRGPAPAPNGYLQSVTSVPLPFGNGTALVGIGGDNAVYVNEQVPGIGSTGWVNLGGYVKSIAVTTYGPSGLPAIFGIGSDNAVYFNQQNASGQLDRLDQPERRRRHLPVDHGDDLALQHPGGLRHRVRQRRLHPVAGTHPATGAGGPTWAAASSRFPRRRPPSAATGLFALGSDNALYYNQYSSGDGWSG